MAEAFISQCYSDSSQHKWSHELGYAYRDKHQPRRYVFFFQRSNPSFSEMNSKTAFVKKPLLFEDDDVFCKVFFQQVF